MSKLVFDGQNYILKRNPLANTLFILYMLFTLFLYYSNYLNPFNKVITTLTTTARSLQLTSITITFLDMLFLIFILGIYFLNVYFEYDVKTNNLTTYSYFIWWKYHRKIINLEDYKEINYESDRGSRNSKKLFLEPRNEARKVYITDVSDKNMNTTVWQSFLKDLRKAF